MTKATLRIHYTDPCSMGTPYFWELKLKDGIASPIQSELDYKSERSALRGGKRFAAKHNIAIERIFKIGE